MLSGRSQVNEVRRLLPPSTQRIRDRAKLTPRQKKEMRDLGYNATAVQSGVWTTASERLAANTRCGLAMQPTSDRQKGALERHINHRHVGQQVEAGYAPSPSGGTKNTQLACAWFMSV